MTEQEVVNKLRESIIFETAWLYERMPITNCKQDEMAETIKVIWNRSVGRAGFGSFEEFLISGKDIREAAEFWKSKGLKSIDIEDGDDFDKDHEDQTCS